MRTVAQVFFPLGQSFHVVVLYYYFLYGVMHYKVSFIHRRFPLNDISI